MPAPWIMYTSADMDQLQRLHSKGQSIFIQQFLLDYSFFRDPEVKTRLLNNFQLKEKYVKMAKGTFKKFKVTQSKIPIGIHVRKGDYEEYERSKNISVTQPNFYINAMKNFQKKLGKKVVFLLITDDIPWCQKNLPDQKNLFLASDPKLSILDSIGHDLAIMSLCQHSIVSRGTFSRWARFLAQGKSISPHGVESVELFRATKWN